MSVDSSANFDPLMNEAFANSNVGNAANTAKNTQNAGANYNSGSVVSGGNMAALKEQYPEFYKKWIQGVGENVCHDMQAAQERIKAENRKHR